MSPLPPAATHRGSTPAPERMRRPQRSARRRRHANIHISRSSIAMRQSLMTLHAIIVTPITHSGHEITVPPDRIAQLADGQPAEHRQRQIMERGATGIDDDAETGRPGNDIVPPHSSCPRSLTRSSRRRPSRREAGAGRKNQRQCAPRTAGSRARQGRFQPRAALGRSGHGSKRRSRPRARRPGSVRLAGRKRGRHRARAIRTSRICARCARSLEASRRKMAYQAMI